MSFEWGASARACAATLTALTALTTLTTLLPRLPLAPWRTLGAALKGLGRLGAEFAPGLCALDSFLLGGLPFGGFLVGVTMLDLNALEYLNATATMVNFRHGLIGLVYGAVFGVIIALFGCYHGMRCGRSALAVGRATTTAVVHSLVGIIVATAIITIICNLLRI